MDSITLEQRSYNMSQIRDKNTKPEILIRKWLWSNGYRYRLHINDLPGKPDIVFSGRRKAIFVNGCFWHKHNCRYFKWPKSNTEFWKDKIEGNVIRDNRNLQLLSEKGWQILVVWECETKAKSLESLFMKIDKFLTI